MRCSAKRVTEHNVTFSPVNGSASGTYTSSALRAPSPRGEGKGGIVPRGQLINDFCPNTETFSAVHNISVVCLPRLARSPGGLGGRSRIEFIVSPLSRRRHNESHFAAQSPERSFFFPLFLSPRKKKRFEATTQSQNLCCENEIRQTGDS